MKKVYILACIIVLFGSLSFSQTSEAKTKLSKSSIAKKYYVTNPNYVLLKKKVNVYKKTNFDKKYRQKSYKEGTRLKVKKIVKTSAGIPRLQLSNGSYISASKSLVLKTSATSNFYTATDGVKQIMTTRNLYSYRSLTGNAGPEFVPAYTVFNVYRVGYNGAGENRFGIINGRFISANKNDVVEVPATINNYYRKYPEGTVLRTQKVVYEYKTLMFRDDSSPTIIPEGTTINVASIIYNELGYPRFKLTNGKYVSTKKALYDQIPWWER